MNSTQQQHYYDVASNLDAPNVRDAIGRIFGDAVVGVVHRVQDPAGEAVAYANLFVDEGRTAVDAEYAPAPIVAAGYSFGAWVAMRVGARDPRVAALVGIAPPVGEFDFAEMVGSPRPKFLIAAGFEELTPVRTMQRFYGLLAEPREMVVVDGADHLFDGRTGEVRDAIAGLFGDFGDRL